MFGFSYREKESKGEVPSFESKHEYERKGKISTSEMAQFIKKMMIVGIMAL